MADDYGSITADSEDEKSGTDDEIIADAKEFLTRCSDVEGENRTNGLNDLDFLTGNHWDAIDKVNRERARRPVMTINKLPTFLHQVTNNQRQNSPSIKVSPVDDKADIKTAEIIQGLIRHIEYSSNADAAYDTAVNSAAAIGFGFFRLITDYVSEDSFDQEIRFKRIRNPFTVYIDPMSQEADSSDMKKAMISSKVSRESFKRDYPDSKIASNGFSFGVGDGVSSDWITDQEVRIAEFYRIEETTATVVELSNGETGYQDDLKSMPKGIKIKRKRQSTRCKTMLYKLTAFDVLERTEVKCKWIPIFPVYGDEIDMDGKIIRAGIVRNAKDPSKMYNYWMTSATEEVAMRSKTPYIGAEGQFEGHEDEWDSANVRNAMRLEYKPTSLDGQLAPAPQRQPMTDIPTGILTMAMHANDNIKATTGLFDSSLGALGNARSGTQERSQQRQGDIANFHFSDNLNRLVLHAGRCAIDMLPHYYDAARVVRIMGEDDSIKPAAINQPIPLHQQQVDPNTGAIKTVLNDLTVGEFDVTVSAGPSYSTRRQEGVDAMIELGKGWPKLMDVAGDKVVRSMDWVGASEIADRIAKTLPPGLQDSPDDEQQQGMVHTPRGDIPVDQAAQMLEEMDQQVQQMGQQLKEAQSGITKAQIDAKSRETVAEINAVSKADVAELTGMIQLLIAKMPVPPVLAQDVAQDVVRNEGTPQPAQVAPIASPPAAPPPPMPMNPQSPPMPMAPQPMGGPQ